MLWEVNFNAGALLRGEFTSSAARRGASRHKPLVFTSFVVIDVFSFRVVEKLLLFWTS